MAGQQVTSLASVEMRKEYCMQWINEHMKNYFSETAQRPRTLSDCQLQEFLSDEQNKNLKKNKRNRAMVYSSTRKDLLQREGDHIHHQQQEIVDLTEITHKSNTHYHSETDLVSTHTEPNTHQCGCQSSRCRLLASHLETDWDNTALDVTSSTLPVEDMSRQVRHKIFFTHINNCIQCGRGEACSLIGQLEEDVSSFFEVGADMIPQPDNTLGTVRHSDIMVPQSQTSINGDQDSFSNTLSSSDGTSFVEKPIKKVLFKDNHGQNAVKKLSKRKIKQLKIYATKMAKGKHQKDNFTVLAIL